MFINFVNNIFINLLINQIICVSKGLYDFTLLHGQLITNYSMYSLLYHMYTFQTQSYIYVFDDEFYEFPVYSVLRLCL